MKSRNVGIVLGAINIILCVIMMYFFLQKDREAPVIHIEDNAFVYEEGMKEEHLFTGVTASDTRDGDVTGRLVLEKILIDADKKSVLLTYGVSDKAGNVTRVSRKVEMVVLPESAASDTAEEEAIALPVAGEAGNTAGF